jgi:hypothetical protein
MKVTLTKVFTTLTALSTTIFAGGDIEPVEPVVDPIVASSGDTMTMTAIILFVVATTMIGLYFSNKQNKI